MLDYCRTQVTVYPNIIHRGVYAGNLKLCSSILAAEETNTSFLFVALQCNQRSAHVMARSIGEQPHLTPKYSFD